jgi:hypothetical protein
MRLVLKLLIYGILIPFIVLNIRTYITNYFGKYYILEEFLRCFKVEMSSIFFTVTFLYYLFCLVYKIIKNGKRKFVVLIYVVLIPVLTISPYIPMIISNRSSLELILVECNFYLFLSFYILFFATKWMYNLVNNKIIKVEVY